MNRKLIVGGSIGAIMLLIFVGCSSIASAQHLDVSSFFKYFNNPTDIPNGIVINDDWYPGLFIFWFIGKLIMIWIRILQPPPI